MNSISYKKQKPYKATVTKQNESISTEALGLKEPRKPQEGCPKCPRLPGTWLRPLCGARHSPLCSRFNQNLARGHPSKPMAETLFLPKMLRWFSNIYQFLTDSTIVTTYMPPVLSLQHQSQPEASLSYTLWPEPNPFLTSTAAKALPAPHH